MTHAVLSDTLSRIHALVIGVIDAHVQTVKARISFLLMEETAE